MKTHPGTSRFACTMAVLGAVAALTAAPARADAQLAADKGCVKCHRVTATGAPSAAPTLEELVRHFESKRDRPGIEERLATKLRTDHEVAGITVHDTLSPESARRLARWLLAGAPR